MRPFRDSRRRRALLAGLGAVGLALTLAAASAALVTVYSNNLSSKAKYRELDRAGGGNRGCDRSYRAKAETMRVEVSGQRHCQYGPPVAGDGPRPDHDVAVEGKVLKGTPKGARKGAYLSVSLRVGRGDSYELQVRPKARRFKLLRNPDGAGFPEAGTDRAIGGIGERNKLRLRADGAKVVAFVNGERLVGITDSNAQQIDGTKTAFGLGSRRSTSRGPIGVFDNIRVRVPNP